MDSIFHLNLPTIEPKIKKEAEKLWIWDIIRKKYVLLTPEEWVRQHFIHHLIAYEYPQGLMQVEKAHHYQPNKLKRCDIVVFQRDLSPLVLVECKAPYIAIGEDALQQVFVYNYHIKARYVVITNGLRHLYYEIFENQMPKLLPSLPYFTLSPKEENL